MAIYTKKFDERFKKAADVFKSGFENRERIYSREMDGLTERFFYASRKIIHELILENMKDGRNARNLWDIIEKYGKTGEIIYQKKNSEMGLAGSMIMEKMLYWQNALLKLEKDFPESDYNENINSVLSECKRLMRDVIAIYEPVSKLSMLPGRGDYDDLLSQFRNYARKFYDDLNRYDGKIYNTEFRDLKNRFIRNFKNGFPTVRMGNEIPKELLLENMKELFPHDRKTANSEVFVDLYYKQWTFTSAGSILKLLKKIKPETELEEKMVSLLEEIAKELSHMKDVIKTVVPLSGRRKIEDWKRKPEPDKFTCSCCFSRQAKNPFNKNVIADHGFIKAGYRAGICDGTRFPPLEQSGKGNVFFMEDAGDKLIKVNRKLGFILGLTEEERQALRKDIFAESQYREIDQRIESLKNRSRNLTNEILFRQYLNEAMICAGGYLKLMEEETLNKVYFSHHHNEWNVYFYSEMEKKGGEKWLMENLRQYLANTTNSHGRSVPFRDWLIERENLFSPF